LEPTTFGIWHEPAAVLDRRYVDAVVRAGGVPVLLPPVGTGHAELVDRIDGLVLAGGADLGDQEHRDEFEFPLLRNAIAADRPVVGVCRGLQVLNVALGGTLHQHLPDVVGHDGHRPALGVFGDTTVTFAADSVITKILGAATKVSCHHHQAIDRIGAGLRVTGRADDGTIEAVELAGRTFVVGVQWHPEHDDTDDRLFAALVRFAR
jgi:putative glutamine amidotransferase